VASGEGDDWTQVDAGRSEEIVGEVRLISHTGNRASNLRAGSYRWIEMGSSEREVGKASIRGATHVAHGVPSDRAGEDICKQSSRMALTIQNLVRATTAVSGRLLIAARGRLAAFRAVSGLKWLS
jgi:hypothetical protein